MYALAGALLSCPGPGQGAMVPTVRPIAPGAAKVDWKTSASQPDLYNEAGNLIVAYSKPEAGGDTIAEFAADGSAVWECHLPSVGAVTQFVRTDDGLTLIAQGHRGRVSRVFRINRHGEYRGGLELLARAPDTGPPDVNMLQVLPRKRVFISVPGYACVADLNGEIGMELIHRSLLSASFMSDGRMLCTLEDPNRFATYNPYPPTFVPIPLEAIFCQPWVVSYTEEPAPDQFRFYGCFCLTLEKPEGVERLTVEVVETDQKGTLLWHYGSPQALKINRFGEKACVTYTNQVIRTKDRTFFLDSFRDSCAVIERNAAGEEARRWLTAPTVHDGNVFGQRRCLLIRAQLLNWE